MERTGIELGTARLAGRVRNKWAIVNLVFVRLFVYVCVCVSVCGIYWSINLIKVLPSDFLMKTEKLI